MASFEPHNTPPTQESLLRDARTEADLESELLRLKAENRSRLRRRGGTLGIVLLFAAIVQWHRELGAWSLSHWSALGSGIPLIGINEVREAIESDDAFLVDVRTVQEYDISHLRTAVSLPLESIEKDGWPAGWPRDKAVLVYCTVGEKSIPAAAILKEQGLKAKSIIGGIFAAAQHNMVLYNNAGPTFNVHPGVASHAWMLPNGYRAVVNIHQAIMYRDALRVLHLRGVARKV